jgi:general secretion pathway protein D
VILNKRSIESTVLVDDGQMIVLGGLIQDKVSDTIEKVPLLGDLPLLGALFRYDTRTQVKTNLMVFLRPVVLRDRADSGAITAERYRQMQGVENRSQMPPHTLLPDISNPRLPALAPAAPAVNEPAAPAVNEPAVPALNEPAAPAGDAPVAPLLP